MAHSGEYTRLHELALYRLGQKEAKDGKWIPSICYYPIYKKEHNIITKKYIKSSGPSILDEKNSILQEPRLEHPPEGAIVRPCARLHWLELLSEEDVMGMNNTVVGLRTYWANGPEGEEFINCRSHQFWKDGKFDESNIDDKAKKDLATADEGTELYVVGAPLYIGDRYAGSNVHRGILIGMKSHYTPESIIIHQLGLMEVERENSWQPESYYRVIFVNGDNIAMRYIHHPSGEKVVVPPAGSNIYLCEHMGWAQLIEFSKWIIVPSLKLHAKKGDTIITEENIYIESIFSLLTDQSNKRDLNTIQSIVEDYVQQDYEEIWFSCEIKFNDRRIG